MNFVVSALVAWAIILTYEVVTMHSENDKLWKVILSLSKSVKRNIDMFDDFDDDEDDDD